MGALLGVFVGTILGVPFGDEIGLLVGRGFVFSTTVVVGAVDVEPSLVGTGVGATVISVLGPSRAALPLLLVSRSPRTARRTTKITTTINTMAIMHNAPLLRRGGRVLPGCRDFVIVE